MDATKAKELARSEGFQDPVLWEEAGKWLVVESFDTQATIAEIMAEAPRVEVDEDGEMSLIWP